MKTFYLVYDHSNEEYVVMNEAEYLKAGEDIEHIQASESEENLISEADFLNGGYPFYQTYEP